LIKGLKAIAKRHWPALRLRTILFLTLLFVAALPGVGAVSLRVYENTLVQQTEAELMAQAAVLSGAYRAAWPGGVPPETKLEPQRPTIDLSAMTVLPPPPEPAPAREAPDRAALAVGGALRPIVIDTARTTLAAIRLLDANGIVLLGRGDVGRSYAALPEVRSALSGKAMTVLRQNGQYQPRYALEFLSRASGIRVHYARPVIAGGRVIGVVLLSRSPRGLFIGIYQDRGKIALGVGAIFLTLLILAGLLSRGIARPIEALGAATDEVARGRMVIPEPPPTAAIEIRELYLNFAVMAERIERRSRYLRDFAAALSHELKTPISGIKGALELLGEHPEMSETEKARFLANASADADRLSHLLSRLLDLARADMAVAEDGMASDVRAPVLAIADAHRCEGLAIHVALGGLPAVSAPPEMLQAVIETLVENSRQAGASHVSISGEARSDRVVLRFSDDGPGIAPADRERIFEPFHTGRRDQGGSGLGLSIARSLLAASAGTITSIATGSGACFEIVLPSAR
jgi:two-component system sensor histidine kinase ChvG